MNRRPPSGPAHPRAVARAAVAACALAAASVLWCGEARAQSTENPNPAPARAYHWVSPPPSEAAGNQVPVAQTFTLPLGPEGTRAADASTFDTQASLHLSDGAFPARPGQTAVAVRIEPLAPQGSLGSLEASVLGNVYRYSAAYVPSGEPVRALPGAAVLGMLFPSPTAEPDAFIVSSADGSTWERLPSSLGSTAGGYVQTRVRSLGMFAVAVEGDSPYATGTGDTSKGGSFPWWAVAVAIAIVAVASFAPLRGRRARPSGEDAGAPSRTDGDTPRPDEDARA